MFDIKHANPTLDHCAMIASIRRQQSGNSHNWRNSYNSLEKDIVWSHGHRHAIQNRFNIFYGSVLTCKLITLSYISSFQKKKKNNIWVLFLYLIKKIIIIIRVDFVGSWLFLTKKTISTYRYWLVSVGKKGLPTTQNHKHRIRISFPSHTHWYHIF